MNANMAVDGKRAIVAVWRGPLRPRHGDQKERARPEGNSDGPR